MVDARDMSLSLEGSPRELRRSIEEDDTVPATRRDPDMLARMGVEGGLAGDERVRDARARARLDGLRDRLSGPYLVNGQVVRARPMFRMNYPVDRAVVMKVEQVGLAVGIGSARTQHLYWGQGTPADLVKLTQALIDANMLPTGPGDLAARIRQLQWNCGIGIDGAGYAREAIRVSSHRECVFYGPGIESFRDLDGNRGYAFAKMTLEDLRPGDLLTLDPMPPDLWGHCAVVYRAETADAGRRLYLEARGATFTGMGPFRIIEVDSSWAAGNAAPYGGYRRDTWIFDEHQATWGWWDPRGNGFAVSSAGPCGDRFHGAYRPR